MSYDKRLEWFKERMGKTIYRDDNECSCGVCTGVHSKGLVIADEMHATYVCDMEFMYKIEGIDLNYRDEK